MIRMKDGRWWLLFILVYISCKGNEEVPDRFDRGTIHISCDETFRPVIEQQVRVYEAEFPNTHIIVHYKPEAECLRDLGVDSIRMVIATRAPSPQERLFIIDSLQTEPRQAVVAHDLIAVIVHPSSPDTIFNMQEIRDLLTGKAKENLIPVFDGLRATSTVRFMLDSVLKGGVFGKNVAAVESSTRVIEYVSETPEAVGFVGFSWIGNSDDPVQLANRKKIKMAWMESVDSAGFYIHPSQFILYTKSYPMVRDLVYILKEKHTGLGRAFANFLESMRGQLVFRRAYIKPLIYPNYLREAMLKDSIN